MISGSIGLRTSAASLMRWYCCAAGASFADPFGNHSRFQVVHLIVWALLYSQISRPRKVTAATVNVLACVIPGCSYHFVIAVWRTNVIRFSHERDVHGFARFG